MKERLTYDDLRQVAGTIVELLRDEPDEQRAVLLLVDHLLQFQGRIQEMTLYTVQHHILEPLLRGVEDRDKWMKSRVS